MRPTQPRLSAAAVVMALLVCGCASPKPREVRLPETMLDIVAEESDYNQIARRPSMLILILPNEEGAALKEIVERGTLVSELRFVRENVAWGVQ